MKKNYILTNKFKKRDSEKGIKTKNPNNEIEQRNRKQQTQNM